MSAHAAVPSRPGTRLLYLSPEHPDPAGNGGEVRLFRILRELGRAGWDVTVVAPGGAEKIARGRALEADGIDLRSVRRPRARLREAVEATLEAPRLVPALATRSLLGWQAEVYLHEMRETLDPLLEQPWDACVVEHDWAIAWLRRLPERLPVAMVFQNLTDELLAGQADTQHGLRRLLAQREARRTRAMMGRYARRLSYGFACSTTDARAIERRWAIPAAVVPNGADVQALAGIGHGAEVPDRILFTGTMSYPPNAQAATWFVREILPIVRRQRPEVTFEIVGGGVDDDVARLAAVEGVTVTGRVPSLDPHLAAASVVVAPLLAGGGTKLKVIEALAAARPLVATSTAAMGIDVVSGVDLLVADGAEAFAAATLELLDDPVRARAIGDRGRQTVAAAYDWTTVGQAMDVALREWLRLDPAR